MSTQDITAQLPASTNAGVTTSAPPKQASIPVNPASIRRSIILALIYFLPARAVLLMVPGRLYLDYDIWWHLRTAADIIHRHALPHTDSFSAFGMGKPWIAYSWLFELIVYGFYRWLGLVGSIVFVGLIATAIGVVLYQAIQKRVGGFAGPVTLTAVGIIATAEFFHVRPWLFTILFFIIEVDLLFGALVDEPKVESPRRLWILPPLFMLWANIHVQFIYGLAVLGVAAVTQGLSLVSGPQGPRIISAPNKDRHLLWLITAASFLATFLNPYTWRIYAPVFQYAGDRATYNLINELGPPTFRSPLDYLLIVTIMAAVFALARARFRGTVFAGVLLLGTTMVSLHSGRDKWVAMVVSLVIIASGFGRSGTQAIPISRWQRLAAIAMAGLAIFGNAKSLGVSNDRLDAGAAQTFPVKAADFVLQEKLAGPLLNYFDFGGYLIWKLPNLPVSMDGRTNVYGGELVKRNIDVWEGKDGWRDNPDLKSANLVIGPSKLPLSYNLKFDPDFQLVYEDSTAVVFTRKTPLTASTTLDPTTPQP